MAVPLLLHGYENWTSREHERRTETVEMKCSKSVAGYTLYDHKAKEKGQKELNTARPQLYAPTSCFFHEFMHLFPFLYGPGQMPKGTIFPRFYGIFLMVHTNTKNQGFTVYTILIDLLCITVLRGHKIY
jgi:hypothetical protein